MNIKKLKETIANLSDDMFVVMEGFDHSYNKIECASVVEAELDPKTREMWEYYDEENKCKKSNKVIDVLLIQ